jgi:hypothetical protein
MSYYDSNFLTIEWNESLGAVEMNWHDFAQGDDYREGLNSGLELVEEKRAANWLADLRDMGTVADDDQTWTNEKWYPQAFDTTLSNMAIIQPESVVANMSVENIIQEVGDEEITTHIFDNRSEAESWLADQ